MEALRNVFPASPMQAAIGRISLLDCRCERELQRKVLMKGDEHLKKMRVRREAFRLALFLKVTYPDLKLPDQQQGGRVFVYFWCRFRSLAAAIDYKEI